MNKSTMLLSGQSGNHATAQPSGQLATQPINQRNQPHRRVTSQSASKRATQSGSKLMSRGSLKRANDPNGRAMKPPRSPSVALPPREIPLSAVTVEEHLMVSTVLCSTSYCLFASFAGPASKPAGQPINQPTKTYERTDRPTTSDSDQQQASEGDDAQQTSRRETKPADERASRGAHKTMRKYTGKETGKRARKRVGEWVGTQATKRAIETAQPTEQPAERPANFPTKQTTTPLTFRRTQQPHDKSDDQPSN